MTSRFRAIMLVLRDHMPMSDVYSLMSAADAVESYVETEVASIEPSTPTIKSPDGHATWTWASGLWDYDHSYLVGRCLDNEVVLMYLNENKKIAAIKELRRVVPGGRLKAFKDAVEDAAAGAAAALYSDPWTAVRDRDDPPF